MRRSLFLCTLAITSISCGHQNNDSQLNQEKRLGSAPDSSNLKEIVDRLQSPAFIGLRENSTQQSLENLYQEVYAMVKERGREELNFDAAASFALRNLGEALVHFDVTNASDGVLDPIYSAPLGKIISNYSDWKNSKTHSSVRKSVREFMQPFYLINDAIDSLEKNNKNPRKMHPGFRKTVLLEYINSFIDSLDRWSHIEPSDQYALLLSNEQSSAPASKFSEEMVGIGVEIRVHKQGAEIVDVVTNSPAERHGLRAGDIILKIDNQSIAGFTMAQIVSLLKGAKGSKVSLTAWLGKREDTQTLVRQSFYNSTISKVQMVEPQQKVAYLKMTKFLENTPKDLETALENLYAKGMKSLIIDLRGNPGGLLDAVASICDQFLTRGECVSIRGKNSSENTVFSNKEPRTWKVPLILLIDQNSASASEILAAAIKQNRRGLILGRQSYGKGTVQSYLNLTSIVGAFSLTTEEFFGPNGSKMDTVGVTPHFEIERAEALVESMNIAFTTAEDPDVRAAVKFATRGDASQIANNYDQGRLSSAPKDPFR